MTDGVRPSLMSPREKVEHHVQTGNLPIEIPGLLDRLATNAVDSERAQDPRWSDKERDRLVAELEANLHPDVDNLIERAVQAKTKELDQQAGELRADAGFNAEIDAGIAARASLMATQASTAADPQSAIDTFEDAIFADNADLIRAVGGAVLTRLKALAANDKHLPLSGARNALLGFELRWQEWKRTHPTPRERLAQIERERSNRRTQIEETAKVILRLHGVGRPAAPAPVLRTVPEAIALASEVREGPAFDRFSGRVRR